MILKKYKDFSYVFLGRLISNCGDSIYTIVLSWYVLEMTNSAWYVG
ncbi:MAG: MFS transporter, partial [Streptococcus sp.]|nr:MFS transporter [Streptococcus sp.]